MTMTQKSTRFHKRINLQVPLEVIYQEDSEKKWVENTQTEQVTICGLGFTLSKPIEPKRLIQLRLPMPRQYRLFDYGKDLYEVWGVIRYLKMLETETPDQIRIMVGAALTGAKPPISFLQNPATLYDLKPFLRDKSFWDPRELPRKSGPYIRSFEDRRPIEMKVVIEMVSEEGKIFEAVEAKTINISESGAALITNFSTDYPRYVVVKTKDKGISLLAAVRGMHKLDSDNLRLHLEFISGKWIFS